MNRLVLVAASLALVHCIIPDRDIDVINEDIQNKQAIRIVEPIELTEDAALACEAAAKEADELAEACPQPGIRALPHFLDPKIPGYNFCACDKGERHKQLAESTLYVEDRDERKGKLDTLYAALQLDLDPNTTEPDQYVRFQKFVNPQVSLSKDDQLNYKPVKRPDPNLRILKLGAGDELIDPCNDVGELNQPLTRGYHTMRLIVTDRGWYVNDEGETQPGVPDLAGGATYDTRVYVFHCNGKVFEDGMSAAEEDEVIRCQNECLVGGVG